jgi:hypothetical protein
MIVTWQCEFCGWLNDNNTGPCRKCGGQTEQKFVKGKWVDVVIHKPRESHLHDPKGGDE